jgi:DNA-binding MurR/RpiR family transcriptional regulator
VYKDRIRTIYEHLSPGYRRIADFLLTQYQEAAFMTAAQVARAAVVDTALVVRFAQRLGYPGYPELISEVQEDVKRDLRIVYEPPEGDDSPGQTLRRNLMKDRNNLEYMHLHLDVATIDAVVKTILEASRLFVVGEGPANYLAEGFAMRLLALGLSVHALSGELTEQALYAASIRPGDAFLGLGLSPMTPGVSVMLKLARSANAKTIGIVGSLAHPLASVTEHVLVAPVEAAGHMQSWTSMASILNGLSQAVAVYKGESAVNGVPDTDQYLNAYSEMLRKQFTNMRETSKAHSSK